MLIKKQQFYRYFQILLLTLSTASIYQIVYLRQNFEVPILQAFSIEPGQLLNYYSIVGLMFFLGYVPSGWLADMIRPKYLISLSLAATGIIGLIYAQIPDSQYLIYIFIGLGISTVFTFWSAHLKCLKLLIGQNEHGRVFGFFEGGKGIVEASLATLAVGLFSWSLKGNGIDASVEVTKIGLSRAIYVYAFACLSLAFLIFIFLDKGEKSQKKKEEKTTLQQRLTHELTIFKVPEIWLVAIILFCGYHLYWATYSFSGYLQLNFKTGSVIAGYITVAKLWMRPIGCFTAGWLGDRFNNALVLAIVMLLSSVSLLIFAYAPALQSLYFLVMMVLLLGALTYAIRGLYWAIMETCDVPVSILGFVIGFISLVGYSGDILIPKANQFFVERYGSILGAQYYYVYTAIIGFIGTVFAFYLYRSSSKKMKAKP